MKLGYELKIEQIQKLTMTPELIQAIQILQFNNQELTDYIKNELLENPILEADKPEPVESVDIRDKIVELNRPDSIYRERQHRENDDDDDFTYEQFVPVKYTLVDYLMAQLQFSRLEGKARDIGKYIVEAIDKNGYLSLTVDEIASNMSATAEEVENVLDVIQTFEPVGVGARDLSECLIIQLASRGQLTEELEFVIENMLEELAENKIAAIAKKINKTPSEVQNMADLIKTLEPKPGRVYDSEDDTKYIIPDIFVEKIDDEYVVTTNDSSTPHLMISSYYSRLSSSAKNDEELSEYLNGRFNSAMWLIKSIEQRKQTIFNVASSIVKCQQEFFDKGKMFLKPLTLKDVADQIGVHESTVSRAINGKYLQCDNGVYELKYFFNSGVSSSDGGGFSSTSVKALIKELVDGENPKKPLSDQAMVNMLVEKGVEISRRTVAKYREEMGILSSSKRRRF